MSIADEPIIGGVPTATEAQAETYLFRSPAPYLTEDDVIEIVYAFRKWGNLVGIRWDVAYAQSCHETNRYLFGNQVRIAQRNPAGIGATNDGAEGLTFPDWTTGIAAYFVHLLAWCDRLDLAARITPNPPKLDPRIPLVAQVRAAKGKATTWASLGGRWAVPGVGYGAAIERHHSAIVALPQETSMTVPKPPTNTKHPSPNRNGYGGKRRVDAVIWHVTAGGEAGSLSWLTNPASGASSNYLIGKDGTIYEMVPPTEDAWANGAVHKPDMTNPLIPKWLKEGVNFNQRTVSIEVVRETSAQGQPGGFTPAQYKSLVTLTAWLCQEFKLTPDRTHIFGHRTIDSVNRPNCPGLAGSEWFALVAAVAALVNGATPPPTQPGAGSVVEAPAAPDSAVDKYLDPITGHTVAPEVRSLYDWLGGLAGAGRPRKPLVKYSDGVLRQLFDNMVLEFDPASGKARIGGLGIAYEMAAGQYPIWGAIVPLI